ncbi:hypothetical protein D3C86_1420670 [compost metagenome]
MMIEPKTFNHFETLGLVCLQLKDVLWLHFVEGIIIQGQQFCQHRILRIQFLYIITDHLVYLLEGMLMESMFFDKTLTHSHKEVKDAVARCNILQCIAGTLFIPVDF